MNFATSADLLAATAVPWEMVYVAALKKHVVVVGMTGHERDSFEASLVVGRGKKRDVKTDNIRAKLAARSLFTAPPSEGGRRMFTDEQADQLGTIRADVLSPIFGVAQRLSGISDDDIDELGKKSSESTTSDTSSSSSPSN